MLAERSEILYKTATITPQSEGVDETELNRVRSSLTDSYCDDLMTLLQKQKQIKDIDLSTLKLNPEKKKENTPFDTAINGKTEGEESIKNDEKTAFFNKNEKRYGQQEITIVLDKEESKSKIVFNKKMAPFVIVFFSVFVLIIAVILFSVPNTGLQGTDTIFDVNSLSKMIASANESASVTETATTTQRNLYVGPINKIMTDNGVIEISTENIVQSTEIETNWFDKVCDFMSSIFGD